MITTLRYLNESCEFMEICDRMTMGTILSCLILQDISKDFLKYYYWKKYNKKNRLESKNLGLGINLLTTMCLYGPLIYNKIFGEFTFDMMINVYKKLKVKFEEGF